MGDEKRLCPSVFFITWKLLLIISKVITNLFLSFCNFKHNVPQHRVTDFTPSVSLNLSLSLSFQNKSSVTTNEHCQSVSGILSLRGKKKSVSRTHFQYTPSKPAVFFNSSLSISACFFFLFFWQFWKPVKWVTVWTNKKLHLTKSNPQIFTAPRSGMIIWGTQSIDGAC